MLIGLHGRLQAGKDTTYERIANFGGNVVRLAFADPLKDSAAAVFGLTRDELEWMKNDPDLSFSVRIPLGPLPDVRYRRVSFTGREYLQRYGTEAHRDVFGDSFWVDQALSQATDPDTLYVVTDVRFPNEVDAIKAAGGYVVHVVGPQGKAEGGHASEQALADELFDYEIDNSVRGDDFANLDAQVLDMMTRLIGIPTGVYAK